MADRPDPDPPLDPPPPSTPNPADPRAPTELPRLPTPGSSRTGSARVGQPPVSAGLVREGALGTDGLARSSSSPVVGGPGTPIGMGSRNPSRERLTPLETSPVAPAPGGSDTTPRRNVPTLAPLALPGASPGSRGGSRPGTDRERPAGVPALDLTAATADEVPPLPAPSGSPEDAAAAEGGADGTVPPPPNPLVETDEERLKKRGLQQDSDAPTARGPVKWVPHTHANPKHAKFCFICLHGKLEGSKEGAGGTVADDVAIRTEEEDLPAPTELKDCGYLLPSSTRFRRAGADFEKGNITAEWLKKVTHRVYGETVEGMLSKQNEDIIHGRDVKLVGHHEDLADRELIERLFELSEEEMDGLDSKLSKLSTWCSDQESRLLDVSPEPRPHGALPEVTGPLPEQMGALEYKPLVDLSDLKGDTAFEAKQAMKEADDLILAKRGFEGFDVDALVAPKTYADMPEVKIVSYEIQREDLPDYDRQQPLKPTRRPVDALSDPFSRPFLFLPEFEETAMPNFSGTAVNGDPRSTKPLPGEEVWLSTTRSMFPDNNEDDEDDPTQDKDRYGWGMVPQRGRIMPPLVDDPYMPPDDLVDEGTGKRMYVVRSVWDPELFTQDGRMVPDIKQLARNLYQPPPFVHPEEPIWSQKLAPKQDSNRKVFDLISLIPVYSFAQFKPKRVSMTMPDFLWDLVKKDASGQGMWDVVKQRHEIPIELRKDAEEKDRIAQEEEDRLRAGEEDEDDPMQDKMGGTQGMLQDAMLASQTSGLGGAASAASPPASAPAGAAASATQVAGMGATTDTWGESGPSGGRQVAESREGLPDVEVEIPGAPRPLGDVEGQFPASPIRSMNTTMEHMQRVQDLPKKGGQLGGAGRKIEEIISDDRFIDTLAEKICLRMGGAGPGGGGPMSPSATMGGTQGGGAGSWATGVLSGKETLDGSKTAQVVKPEPPSFTEPVDESSKAELPRALQGNLKPKVDKEEEMQGATVGDSNLFTQEKMRGECYVRLLMKPEEHAARKVPQPFRPETWAPDAELISKRSRPHLRMPPKPPIVSEDGEILEEDEYQDFESSNEIVFSFVRHNRYDAVEALIQQDQDVITSKDDSENTLLHTACQNNNRRLVKLLLKNHIGINSKNVRGNTALHYCYQYGFSDLAEYLLAHGADDSILNNDGFVPAQGTGRSEKLSGAQHSMRTGG